MPTKGENNVIRHKTFLTMARPSHIDIECSSDIRDNVLEFMHNYNESTTGTDASVDVSSYITQTHYRSVA